MPSRDARVMAAAWEDDDASDADAGETDAHSVVVKRSKSGTPPTSERLAQRPLDPFDLPEDESPESELDDAPIEEVEESLEKELQRRNLNPDPTNEGIEQEDLEEDPFDEPMGDREVEDSEDGSSE